MRSNSAWAYAALAVLAIGSINFLWFWTESVSIGGDALNGYEQDGRYFVASHGTYTEVTRAVWEWSRLHAISVVASWPLVMFSAALLVLRLLPRFMGGHPGLNTVRVEGVRASGPEIASVRCGGQLGDVHASSPLLHVSVFPGGVLVKPILMAPKAILWSEIRGATFKRNLLGTTLDLEHVGGDLASPVRLGISRSSAVAKAIEQLASAPPSDARPPAANGPAARSIKPDQFLRLAETFGLVWGVAFVAVAFWAASRFGAAGFAFALVAVAILAVNVRRFMRRNRRT